MIPHSVLSLNRKFATATAGLLSLIIAVTGCQSVEPSKQNGRRSPDIEKEIGDANRIAVLNLLSEASLTHCDDLV